MHMVEQIREIKGYELQDLLGEGGFGTVYRAYQPLIKREVAIKVIRARYANQPEFIRRFEAEAQLVARLEHLHIVPLYDFWRDPSGAYLVMRMLRGGSLRETLQSEESWELEDIKRLTTQIASALSVAHRNGVVHRDLKPANILLDEERNAYLTDFGIAKDVQHDEDAEEEEMVGTPAYSSPEQLQSLLPTPQTDIYSFGLIVYEMLTGKPAVPGDNLTEIIVRQISEPLPDIDTDAYGLPHEINDVLRMATAKDPDARYVDANLFARDMVRIIDGFQQKSVHFPASDMDNMVVVPDDTLPFALSEEDLLGYGVQAINPYKGLRAFQEGDADDFFGREVLTQTLLNRLSEDIPNAHFLAVVGPSGSGKSSVVKAGVIPAVREGRLNRATSFYVAEMVPGADVLDELEAVLMSIAVTVPDDMRQQLVASESGLHDLLLEILPDDNSALFLLIDQFEEIFTQTEDNAARVHYMNSLRYAVTHPQGRLWAVITIRADFYDKPLLYPEFGALVRERSEIVLPLSRGELESAIAMPAKRVGVGVEPELIDAIVDDVQEEPGALPLLQYALTELFDQRDGRTMTLASYRERGGILGFLARRAEELYLGMDSTHQEAVRQLFLRLVTLGEGTEDTRRRVRWSELAFTDVEDDPLRDVLETFTRYRLLTGDNDPQTREPTIEVAHEALIRQWTRLREWLADNRENIRIQRQIAASLQEWQKNNRDVSFLARGMRLGQFEQLLQNADIGLTDEERGYIEVSIEQREAAIREEAERQQRERELEARARRFLRGMLTVVTLGLLVALGLALYALSLQQEAVAARDDAEREAVVNNSISLANRARLNPRGGEEPMLGLGYAVQANSITSPPAEVQRTLAFMAWQPGARRQLVGHTGEVWGVTYSPDGGFILSGAGDGDNSIIMWDAQTGEVLDRLTGHDDRVYVVAITPDGRFAASGSQDTSVIIWDMESREIVHRVSRGNQGHTVPIFSLAFTPDGSQLLSGAADGTIIVWDVATGEQVNRFGDIHSQHILDMDISTDGELVFSGSFDGTVRLWELASGDIVEAFEAGQSQITGSRFLPDGNGGVTSDQDANVIFWSFAEDRAVRTIAVDGAPLRGGLLITPDERQLITGDDIGNIKVFDLESESDDPVLEVRGHDGRITTMDISPDGSELVTSSFDRTLIIWDLLGRGAEVRRFDAHESRVYDTVLSADGRTGVSGDVDGRVYVWDTQTGDISLDLSSGHGTVYNLALSGERGLLAGATEDGTVLLWDVETGDVLQAFTAHEAPVRAVAFNADGSLLAAAGGQVQVSATRLPDNRVIVWDVETGDIVQELDGHSAAVRALAFHPSENRLLSGGDDSRIFLWDVDTGEAVNRYNRHRDSVWSLSFDADGTRFLSGSLDSRVILWDVEAASVIDIMDAHNTGVRAVAFHPDGVHALSAGGDVEVDGVMDNFSLLYWDLDSAEVLRRFPGHMRTVRSIALSSDGQTALSAADDGHVIVWRVDSLEGLLTQIGTHFDVYCVDDLTNDYCVPDPQVEQVEAEDGAGFPTQSDELEVYTAGSFCVVPAPEDALSTEAVDTSAFAKPGPYVIGYSSGGVENTPADWIQAWAVYEASQQDNVEDFIVRDAGGSAQQQVADIEALVDRGVDVLIVNPVEQSDMSALENVIEDMMEAGIPVVMVGARTPEAVYVSYVGQDNFEVGCIMSQEIIAIMDGEGALARLHPVDGSPADERFKDGEDAVFAAYPGMAIIAEGPTGYNRARAFSLTSPVEVNGILAYTGEIALGGQFGLSRQGLPFVPVVSDHSVALAQFMQDENLPGVLVRSSTQMGADAVQVALAIMGGEPVSQFVRIQPSLIPAETLVEYDLEAAPEDGYLGDWEELPQDYWPE